MRQVVHAHRLQPHPPGSGERGQEQARAAEEHVLDPGHGDDVELDRLLVHADLARMDAQGVARLQVVDDDLAVQLDPGPALSRQALHAETGAAEDTGAQPLLGAMSRGTIWPGSLAAKASRPSPPAAVYSVMNSVPPAIARPSAPRKPPCCPPTEVPVCIWIAIDIQESSPDSAKTLSFGCMLSSRTGITVPTIFDSMTAP